MKRFLIVLAIALSIVMALSPPAAYSGELGLGDRGYKHNEYHMYYQKLFDQGRCYCKTGECRPTTYQPNHATPSGFDVKINGKFYPIPEKSILRSGIPPMLWREEAHVCAYPKYEKGVLTNEYEIECVVLSAGT